MDYAQLRRTVRDVIAALDKGGPASVDVVQSRSWFAVNSLINCVDRFAPPR